MPLELAKKMVESVSRPGHLVYDPFGGRGTTGLACAALGRRFIMSEIDPVHARLARSDMLHIGRNWTAQ